MGGGGCGVIGGCGRRMRGVWGDRCVGGGGCGVIGGCGRRVWGDRWVWEEDEEGVG